MNFFKNMIRSPNQMKNLFIEREDLDDDLGSCGLRGRHLTAQIEPGLGDVQRMNVDDRQSDDRRLVRRLSLVLLAFFFFLFLLLSTAALLFSSLCHDRRYLRSITAVLCDAVGFGSATVGASGQKLLQTRICAAEMAVRYAALTCVSL